MINMGDDRNIAQFWHDSVSGVWALQTTGGPQTRLENGILLAVYSVPGKLSQLFFNEILKGFFGPSTVVADDFCGAD